MPETSWGGRDRERERKRAENSGRVTKTVYPQKIFSHNKVASEELFSG